MLIFLALLAAALGALFFTMEGFFRTAVVFCCTLLAGLLAFNWFAPIADAAKIDKPEGHVAVLLVLFVVCWGALFQTTCWIASETVDSPWLLDRAGGFVLGAWIGWLTLGIGAAGARLHPYVDEWIQKNRPADEQTLAEPDVVWLNFVKHVSERGLKRNPLRPFDPHRDFLQRPLAAEARAE